MPTYIFFLSMFDQQFSKVKDFIEIGKQYHKKVKALSLQKDSFLRIKTGDERTSPVTEITTSRPIHNDCREHLLCLRQYHHR